MIIPMVEQESQNDPANLIAKLMKLVEARNFVKLH